MSPSLWFCTTLLTMVFIFIYCVPYPRQHFPNEMSNQTIANRRIVVYVSNITKDCEIACPTFRNCSEWRECAYQRNPGLCQGVEFICQEESEPSMDSQMNMIERREIAVKVEVMLDTVVNVLLYILIIYIFYLLIVRINYLQYDVDHLKKHTVAMKRAFNKVFPPKTKADGSDFKVLPKEAV